MGNAREILIIGAGAAGLSAAIAAGREDARVTVLDHMDEAGKKLSITGNGRCNFTNTDISSRYYHSSAPGFIESALSDFGSDKCIDFIESVGVGHIVRRYDIDERGYIYPATEHAGDIRDALYKECLRLGVRFYFGADASLLTDPFSNAYGRFDALILAAGGNARPDTGSDGSIYPLIMRLGIPFSTFYPALSALYSKDALLNVIKGKRTIATATLIIDGTESVSRYGQIQFNAHSISGIPVMELSGDAHRALKGGHRVSLSIYNHEFTIYRTAGFMKSQVSGGGIDLSLIDPVTFMYKPDPRIYAVGELLDIYGDCGGYNLHFAFMSGIRAGRSAARR